AGATKGLVSTALLFFSTHSSSRSNAAVLLSSGTLMVAPAPTTFKVLDARRPCVNFLSLMSIETEFDSAATSSSKLNDPRLILTGYCLPRSSFQFGEDNTRLRPSSVRTKSATMSSSSLRLIEQRSNLSDLKVAAISQGPIESDLLSSAARLAFGESPRTATIATP